MVESYRTERGPRQRVVAYLGQLEEPKRKGVKKSAEGKRKPEFVQAKLFDDNELEPEWVEINAKAVRVENEKAFGGPWLALELIKLLGFDEFFQQYIPQGEEHVSWSGVEIRKRCITRPTEHQEILLQRLGLKLPRQFKK